MRSTLIMLLFLALRKVNNETYNSQESPQNKTCHRTTCETHGKEASIAIATVFPPLLGCMIAASIIKKFKKNRRDYQHQDQETELVDVVIFP